jgi:cell division protein FtsQ
MANKMWFNLVEQINVLPNQGIEIVPRVGNHVVYLGQLPWAKQNSVRRQLITEMINSKMTRLEKFYRYGLSQAGWNKYKYINLEFDNQIVCKK